MRIVIEFALACLLALGAWLFVVVVFSFGG
jgi:hypothetical protein